MQSKLHYRRDGSIMITIKPFGSLTDGRPAHLFELRNSSMFLRISDYGGTIVSVFAPDKTGELRDIVLGFDNVSAYELHCDYFGAIIGRHANRIKNGEFRLNDKTYLLALNNGPNHMHGGIKGFDKKLWDYTIKDDTLILHYFSPDMEEGYPGNLEVYVQYSLSEDNCLEIQYTARCDSDTVVNLTNHSYFNLSGHDSGCDILDHMITINSDSFTQNDGNCLPTGTILPVEYTPMDLRTPTCIGDRINDKYEQLQLFGGFDHNFIIRRDNTDIQYVAQVFSPRSQIRLTVYSDKPGVQFYTANNLTKVYGKKNAIYRRASGLCLETQYFPNAMEHKHFPSPILRKGELYSFKTKYHIDLNKS